MKPKMKIIASTCVAVCMSIGSFFVAAQQLNVEQQAQLNELKATALKSDLSYQLIESLTTEVGHRLMGSDGDKKSIVWAADVNDDVVGGVFHPQSLGLAMKSDFKIETQRDASLRATEIVGTVTYGTGVVKDDFGCQVTVDGAL
jgi:hypothetical protein